jgi:hypothetical protein
LIFLVLKVLHHNFPQNQFSTIIVAPNDKMKSLVFASLALAILQATAIPLDEWPNNAEGLLEKRQQRGGKGGGIDALVIGLNREVIHFNSDYSKC